MQQSTTTAQRPLEQRPQSTSRFDPRRVYTVLAFLPLLYAAIRYLPPQLFSGLVLIAGVLALFEFYQLWFETRSHFGLMGVGFTGFATIILGTHWPEIIIPSLLMTLVCIASIPLFSRMPLEHSLRDGAIILFGLLYLGLTLSPLSMIRLLPNGEWFIFFLLMVTWASDAGAYYIGTLFGRHRLAPSISPKKTVEGLLGGLVCAILVAYLVRGWFLPALTSLDCLALGSLLTITGLWGDLTESAMKRSAGVKDSGRILPGHGGMLDRLDSLLFTAPTFYYYIDIIGRLRSMQ